MSDREFQILFFLRSAENPSWVDVLNTVRPPVDTDAVMKKLLSDGAIEKSGVYTDYSSVTITAKGLSLLLDETDRRLKEQLAVQKQKDREQAEEQKKLEQIIRDKADSEAHCAAEHRFQIKLSFSATVLSALAGAIFTNLDRLIPWLLRLLGV